MKERMKKRIIKMYRRWLWRAFMRNFGHRVIVKKGNYLF